MQRSILALYLIPDSDFSAGILKKNYNIVKEFSRL